MSAPEPASDRAARLRRAIDAKRASTARGDGLSRRPAGEPAYLGELQRGLWFVHQVSPASPAYNLCSAFRVHGPLDVERLQEAARTIVARHRLLRSTFEASGDDPVQVIHDNLPITVERIAMDGGSSAAALTREAARSFDLERGPLVRLALIEEGSGGERFLLLALHHILADERALEFLWSEMAAAYEGRLTGTTAPAAQYDDYVHWLRQTDRQRRDDDLEFWRRRLDPLPDELRLPFERQLPAADEASVPPGRLIERTIAPSSGDGIRRLAARAGATPFMVFAFAFRLLLHRYTEGQRVAFATPISIRAHPDTAEMIGYFLNPLVICTGIDEQQPVGEAVTAFSRDLAEALGHGEVPFDLLAADLCPRRQFNRHPIFQVMFVYQEAGPAPSLGEARLEPVTLDLGAAKFDLTLFVTERGASPQIAIEYRADRFDEVWMRGMLDHYERLIEQLPVDTSRRTTDVPMLSAAEEERLASWERGPQPAANLPTLVPHLVIDQAGRQPQAPAVICGGIRQGYAGLGNAAQAIAHALVAGGVRSGDRVAVFVDRSVHMIAALLGSHLAGAAYVPVDPSYPRARNQQVLADAGVRAVLTTSALRDRLPAGSWRMLALDTIDEGPQAATPALPALSPDLRAYILYTSGSTGQPKGVVITHANLRVSTLARLQVYQTPPARFLLLPSIAFDSSVAGIFWTLATGGALVVPTDDEVRDVRRLADLIVKEQVTTLLCVPSLYAQLLAHGGERLRGLDTVIVAGESCPSRLVDEHVTQLEHVRLVNEYGPTEATVWATVHEIVPDDASRAVPIGRPIPGVRVEVRDRLGRRIPAGIPGDASIVGPTVADGYWRRDDMTAARFSNAGDAQRRYHTGDRLAWTTDGRLLFLGRDDEQIKLRGYRIEPGEIEAALLEHPGIEQAAVVARAPAPATPAVADPATTQLVAFVVRTVTGGIDGWRQTLANRLPEHMVPARVVELPDLPRLPNGKVDRRRLLALPLPSERPAGTANVPGTREQALISLWEGLLGRYGLGATDNFFEWGGHSLLVIQMIAAIERDFEVTLTAADVFQHPTVRDLARRIELRGGTQTHSYQQLFPIQPGGRKTPFIMAVPDFFTEALAARFRGERPVYGVRGVSLRAEGNRGRWPTLTHLAEEVVDEVQRRFQGGPVVLAGYSFGAWLAIETARVAERRGIAVQRLYLIAPMPVDFYHVGPFRVRIDGLRRPLRDLGIPNVLRHYLRGNHPLTRAPYRRGRQWLLERPWRRTLALIGALRRRRGLPVTPPLLQADVRVERFRLHADYRPGPVRTPAVFFNPVGPASDSAATWRPYFQGPVTVHAIPDPHDEASVGAARQLVLEHLGELGD